MGSYGNLIRQSIILIILVGVIAVCALFSTSASALPWIFATGSIALIFFVCVSFKRRREILRMAEEVDMVLHNGRDINLECYREGDIAVLSNELAKMIARLKRTASLLEEERGALACALADISHQIRTPLTSMNLTLASIEQTENENERRMLIRRLEHTTERVSWLVTTLLRLARADAGALKVEQELVSAHGVIRRAIAPLEASFELREVELIVDDDQDVVFTGDKRWCAEALENIVKNCMEHTPTGGRVTIEAVEDTLSSAIIVSDTGCGIREEDLPHIFERFYRRTNTSSTSKEGFGIGLALAQTLISAQKGTIRASNNNVGGARFEIRFPKFVV